MIIPPSMNKPKELYGSLSLEYTLFYKILHFVQGTKDFGHIQLMNNTILELLREIFFAYI